MASVQTKELTRDPTIDATLKAIGGKAPPVPAHIVKTALQFNTTDKKPHPTHEHGVGPKHAPSE